MKGFSQKIKNLSPGLLIALYGTSSVIWIVASGALLFFSVSDSALHGPIELLKGLAFVAITSGLLYFFLTTWQKQAETQKQETEHEFRQVLQYFYDQPFVGMTIIDPESGRWLNFNNRVCEMLGYSRKEFDTKTWKDLIHPDDLAESLERLECIEQGKAEMLSATTRYWHKDGSILHLQVNLNCLREPDGQVKQFIATVLDVSQLQQTREATLRQKSLLENMENVASIGAWSLDLRNMELSWSKEIYHIHEVDPATPPILHEAINFYAPEARPIIQQAVQDGIEKGTPWDLELPFITLKGHRIWVRSQGKAIIENGKAILLHGAFQDITARKLKESESSALLLQQQTILSNTTVGITQLMHRTIIRCNQRLEQMFGYEPGELDGQSTRVLFPSQEDFEAIGERAYAHLEANNAYSEEATMCRKDGGLLQALITGSAIDPAHPQEGSIWSYIDVSEMHAAKQEAQRLLAAVEQSPVAIVITDPSATIRYANGAFLQVTGYTQQEVIGQNPRILKSGETSPQVYKDMWETLGSGQSWHGMLKNRKKDGTLFLERVSITPIYDLKGKLSNYLAVKEDITELRQAEEKVLENSMRFEQLAQQSRTVIWEVDAQGLYTYVSHSVLTVLGHRREELEGKMHFYDLHPEEGREQFKALAFGIFERQEPFKDLSNPVLTKSGETIWVSTRGIPIQNPDGSLQGYRGSDIDITTSYLAEEALKRSREQFELAVRGSNDGIWDWDLRDNSLYLSPRWKEQVGYADDELKNEFATFESLVHPDDWLRIMERARQYLNGSQTRFQMEFRMRHKDGIYRWILARGEAFRDENDIPVRMAGSHTDISEYKVLLQELIESEDLLKNKSQELDRYRLHLEELVQERTAQLSGALQAAKAADLAKDEFLANISHEMRTPLNIVIGLSDLARRASSDGKVLDYLEKITGAGRNLAGIINDLLDLSKIAAGHLKFESIVFSPRQLVERSRNSLQHKAEEKGLLLSEKIDANVPELLVGDPMRIEQIILNLISNAIKFTPNGRIDVRIKRLEEKPGKTCLGIEVEDTGIGISEADLDKMFKPFSQADASISRKFGGTGLGLTICKRLAEMMDGDIVVDSRAGSGSIFRVRLWLDSKTPEAPVAGKDPGDEEVSSIHYRNVQVLAVDDQPDNLAIVNELLKTVGIRPRLASNGLEALDILKAEGRENFDLVLMDMQMPVMDGRTASLEIRKLPEFYDLPIIAMTAHTMAHEKKMIESAGVNDHIGKPFETDYFFSVLAKWIPRIKQEKASAKTGAASKFPAINGLDTTAGLSRFAGNAERYQHWLQAWATSAPQQMTELTAALAQDKRDNASQLAHALRGRAGMLGAADVHTAGNALEQALTNGTETEVLLQTLQEAVNKTCFDITQVLGESKEAKE